MTISNVVSGFRMTGIYPTDRQALLKLIPDSSNTLEESGLAFVPLICPSPRCRACKSLESTESVRPESQQIFEEQEEKLFQKWYEANSNVTENERYNAWLEKYHPEYVWMKPLCSTGVQQFLSVPEAPHKIPTVNLKSCGRVLTSQENMDMLTKKAEENREAEIEKQRRKQEREAKRLEKQAEKEGMYIYQSIHCNHTYIKLAQVCLVVCMPHYTLHGAHTVQIIFVDYFL